MAKNIEYSPLIIGLNGSPDKNGNTAALIQAGLDICSKRGARTELIHCREALQGSKNPFCINCQSPCEAKCAVGKPLEQVFSLLAQADGLIIGSPVYFGTVSGQLKAFWDKTRSLRTKKVLLNVPGGAVTVGASQYGGQETALRAIHDMMLVHGMIIVGDGYVDDDCGHLGAMATKPSTHDENGMRRAKILGKRIFEVACATNKIRVRAK